MAKLKIESLGGEERLKVEISVDSGPYQALLNAQKERERLREENGGDTAEGIALVRKAVEGVNVFAKEKFIRDKTN